MRKILVIEGPLGVMLHLVDKFSVDKALEEYPKANTVYFIALDFHINDIEDLTQEQKSALAFGRFNSGDRHEFWRDLRMINVNTIGFDPKKHVFICHKCHGALSANSAGIKYCSCISGWIRPYQRYVEISSVK